MRVAHGLEDPVPVLETVGRPGCDGPFVDGQIRVRDDELGIDLQARPESVARGAGSVRRVEREVARRQLVEREPAVRARELLREGLDLLVALVRDDGHRRDPLGQLQRLLDRIGDPSADVGLGDQSVDDDLDRVLVVPGAAGSAPRGRGPRRRSAPGDIPCAPDPGGASRTPPSGPAPPARAPGSGSPRGAPSPGRRSAPGSVARWVARSCSNGGVRPSRTGPGGSRRPP